ncbi:VOC family protein [Euzebya sp.]|uniref:VOC family protein n=1 Tax=Euzebya sp. TaxID=1971409 RepID=UPI0035179F0D
MPAPTVLALSLDCDDASASAAFWAGLLDGEVTYEADGVAAVEAPGLTMYFGELDGYQPPGWPSDAKQMHLDLRGADPGSYADTVRELGGSVPDDQPGGDRWTVYLDPAGHPFCISGGDAS